MIRKTRADLIYNAHSGRQVVRRHLGWAITYLESNGWVVSVHETRGPRDAIALARRAAANGSDVVIAAGGDGTVNEVANGIVGTDSALGVLPLGTVNVWALQMGIPIPRHIAPAVRLDRLVSGLEARVDRPLPVNYYRSVLLDAARILVEGETYHVDVGEVGGRRFLMWAGVGLDAEVTVRVSPEDKKAFGPWAFVGSALDVMREYKSTNTRLTLDGEVKQVQTSFVVVSNIQLYGGALPMGARACVDDGLLDVCIFKGDGLLNYVQHVLKVAARQHLSDSQIEYHQCQEIVVESADTLPVHVDDEPFTQTPVTIRIVPGALRAILPKNVPAGLFANR